MVAIFNSWLVHVQLEVSFNMFHLASLPGSVLWAQCLLLLLPPSDCEWLWWLRRIQKKNWQWHHHINANSASAHSGVTSGSCSEINIWSTLIFSVCESVCQFNLPVRSWGQVKPIASVADGDGSAGVADSGHTFSQVSCLPSACYWYNLQWSDFHLHKWESDQQPPYLASRAVSLKQECRTSVSFTRILI